MTEKSLDRKLANILADPDCGDFVLADAKDADMAFGLSAPGQSPEHHAQEGRFRTLDEYRMLIREVIRQGLVDIVLMSGATSELLTIREGLFKESHVTPAVRANDATDIWLAAGSGRYTSEPARPFSTTTIDQAMCGKADCRPEERSLGADLGLYSVTFNNDTRLDLHTLEVYKSFRLEGEGKGFRHFLEVFHPNAPGENAPKDLEAFVNDHIVRTLAGVPSAGRPVFLKIPYHGPEAMERLARYDRSLIVGILGGSSGTTMDAFQMLYEAKKYGARVALYGRKINNAEHQLGFIYYLRSIADGKIMPGEAVRAYHADLRKMGISPYRPLDDDLTTTQTAMSYGGGTGDTRRVVQRPGKQPRHTNPSPDTPDFSKMTAEEKVQWNLERWNRILGD